MAVSQSESEACLCGWQEICLGILGNLACHPCPLSAMEALQEGALVRSVVHHLFSNHPPVLIEACRTLSAGLHGEGAVRWVGALDTEEVVGRVMWMAANTQQPTLLEKSTELLLAMVDGPRTAPSSLLPVLLRLGFVELLTDLLASQVQAVQEGTSAQGDAVLDTVLQITEALSLSEECGATLAGNKSLFLLACHVLRLKEGIGPAGISATVLIANLLAEDTSLVHHLTYGERGGGVGEQQEEEWQLSCDVEMWCRCGGAQSTAWAHPGCLRRPRCPQRFMEHSGPLVPPVGDQFQQ